MSDRARFEVRTTADSHMAWVRTRLALERTMMAWVRTAISLIGFGFVIVQFFDRLRHDPGTAAALLPEAPKYLGMSLIACGILSLLVAIWQYLWTVRYFWGETFAPIAGMAEQGKHSPVFAIALLLVFIGAFAFVAVFLRIV